MWKKYKFFLFVCLFELNWIQIAIEWMNDQTTSMLMMMMEMSRCWIWIYTRLFFQCIQSSCPRYLFCNFFLVDNHQIHQINCQINEWMNETYICGLVDLLDFFCLSISLSLVVVVVVVPEWNKQLTN